MEYQKFEKNRKTADAMRRNGPSQHRRDGISWNIYEGQHLHPTAYKKEWKNVQAVFKWMWW